MATEFFQQVVIPADARLGSLRTQRETPRALQEACTAYLARSIQPGVTLIEAATDLEDRSVLTALLALDGEIHCVDGWHAVADLIGEAQPLLDGGESPDQFRVALLLDRRSGDHSSAYAEQLLHDTLIGVGAGITLLTEAGPIATAHLAICGAGPDPFRLRAVEDILRGRRPSAELAEEASEIAWREAEPFAAGTVVAGDGLLAVRDVCLAALSEILGHP
jgi:CO/xanthine dehydrogenase FAD-binding subunit